MFVSGAPPTTDGLVACVSLEENREYQFGAAMKLLSEGGASGNVRVGFVWQVNTECTAALNNTPTLLSATSAPDWLRLDGSAVVPAGAVAAGFLLQTRKLAGDEGSTLTGRFDNAVVSLVECGDAVRMVVGATRHGGTDASAVTASDALFMLQVAVGGRDLLGLRVRRNWRPDDDGD